MKVALFLATGFEETEAIATVDVLRRAQIAVETISITDEKTVLGAHNVPVIADKLFGEADFSEMEALVLPGGMPGAKNLNAHEGLKKLITKVHGEGKIIAAICAAPIVFGGLGLLKGKKATCYPGFEAELFGAQKVSENVAVDGNITTGRGPGPAFEFALSLVNQIAGLQTKKEVQNGLLL